MFYTKYINENANQINPTKQSIFIGVGMIDFVNIILLFSKNYSKLLNGSARTKKNTQTPTLDQLKQSQKSICL